MKKVKILGAGSIGNHLSHASRKLEWKVDLCDVDPAALERTKTQIYPTRYGRWDEEIQLYLAHQAPQGNYDLIVIGTPPDTHMMLALQALKEKPKALLVEKPLCTPDLKGAEELYRLSKEMKIPVFVGYDHVVGLASEKVKELLGQSILGELQTLDVEFREHWGGIFNAHPWLNGPQDSYLGFWKRGGGASGEHSHAVNLWQYFAHIGGLGRVTEVTANVDYIKNEKVFYDRLCLANLRTESGLIGRVVQDVVTQPVRKWARLQGTQAAIEWQCGYQPGCDAVIEKYPHQASKEHLLYKTRPDDFIQELKHIEKALSENSAASPLSLERSLESMLVVAAFHKSAQESKTVVIDYNQGYVLSALRIKEVEDEFII